MAHRPRLRCEDYTVAWVCALPVELAAAQEMLDEEHDDYERDPNDHDDYQYALGSINGHNVAIGCLPAGWIGNNPATAVAMQMKATFKNIRFGLMVGIGGGVPSAEVDIRLGDVVVSQPDQTFGGVVQYDAGKSTPSGFARTGSLNSPPTMLLFAVSRVKANDMRGKSKLLENVAKLSRISKFQRNKAGPDVLFEAAYDHEGGRTCNGCSTNKQTIRQPRDSEEEVKVHYGTIASGNQVMKNAAERDRLSTELGHVLCFDMEAAGLMNSFPCLVIRGICDYADSHKNNQWQPYAAGTAAAYAKGLLSFIPATEIAKTRTAEEIIRETVGPQKEIKGPSGERATALPLNIRSSSLDQHKRNGPQFRCQACDRTFQKIEGMNQHMDVKNHRPQSNFPCKTCSKEFSAESAAKGHMATTGHGIPKILCRKCDKKFHKQSAANAHMAAVH